MVPDRRRLPYLGISRWEPSPFERLLATRPAQKTMAIVAEIGLVAFGAGTGFAISVLPVRRCLEPYVPEKVPELGLVAGAVATGLWYFFTGHIYSTIAVAAGSVGGYLLCRLS